MRGSAWLVIFVALVALIVGTAVPRRASAQEESETSPTVDVVYLKNGTILRGTISELVPEDHVTMIVSGQKKRIPWSDIDHIASQDTPLLRTPQPPKAPPPAPTTPAPLDKPPGEPPPPKPQWRANRPLLTAGAIMFGVGYGAPAVVGLPSTLGLVGRVVILVFTIALPCIFNNDDDYLCKAEHGSIQLLIPFVGPILFAENHPQDTIVNERGRTLDEPVRVLLYTASGLQIAGLAAIIAGIVAGKPELPDTPTTKKSSTDPKFFVRPLDQPNTAGLTFGVHSF